MGTKKVQQAPRRGRPQRQPHQQQPQRVREAAAGDGCAVFQEEGAGAEHCLVSKRYVETGLSGAAGTGLLRDKKQGGGRKSVWTPGLSKRFFKLKLKCFKFCVVRVGRGICVQCSYNTTRKKYLVYHNQ